MRLKSLSIKGFKSFADDTEINFNENLIGIVGPNGSGKSNIVDSIRWVLGEQKTSELRLDSMADVLFNGTKVRKAGRVARVTLTFDNTRNILPTDYNEVSVSRVLYRDGNSEYRLNDVVCRKKDIQSLFLDSGIGSNSYAIISLNMVEDILHDNGGSRRYMIEQAAGISKYKIRKKETLSKLKSTAEDLERVNDLLFEIQKNLSSFERQAKRTEKYNILKEEYKELAINISKVEIKELSKVLQELRQKLQAESDLKISIEKTLNEKQAILEKLKFKILEAEQTLNKDQQEFNLLIEQLGKAENLKNLTNQQIINSRERLKDIQNNLESLGQSESNSKFQIEKASKAKIELKGKLDEAKSEIEKANVNLQRLQSIYEDLRSQEKKIKDQVAANRLIKSNAEREIESFKAKVNLLGSDIEQLKLRRSEMVSGQAVKTKELENAQQIWKSKEEELQVLSQKIETLENQDIILFEAINGAISARSKKELEKSSFTQRIKFIENIIEKNEGVPESVKYLISQKKKCHLFSEVIEVKNERYTQIVELFLEPYLQHVVVSSDSEALELYHTVRGAQKGKVKIFVLDNIGTTMPCESKEGLISLRDIITCDSIYMGLIDKLSQNVYLSTGKISDLDLTVLQPGDTILSIDDYLIYKVGEIYGGSNTLFEGVQLGRRKLLEKLQASVSKLDIELTNDQKEILQLKEEKRIILTQIEQTKKERKTVQFDNDRYKQSLYQIESQLSNHKENLAQLDKQIEAKNELLVQATQQQELKISHLEEINRLKIDEMSDDQLTTELANIYHEITTVNSEKEIKSQHLYEVQNQYNIILKEEEFHNNTLASVRNRRIDLDREHTVLIDKINDGEKNLFKTKNDLSQLYQDREKLQSKLSAFEDSYYKEKGKIFEQEKEINEIRNQMGVKDSIIHVINEKSASASFDLKAIHDRNEIEFGFRIKDVEIADEVLASNLNDLKASKVALQEKIRGFGEINPMAITAYNEIKERYEHINKEQQDIINAKSSLEETISEIELAASTKFNESLDQIRTNFKKVFQGLFSEDDDCDIVLLDTDDPLEAKIEIVAKPKGKRPKSINQLSGGEKTLTAASFLFALYLLKPAPFCIFDEVDAPLDDVNVQKFNKIIRKFSEDSQFIIITHNKLTMAEVDILYGVFLKEHGVSGVSAVDFRNYEPAEILESES